MFLDQNLAADVRFLIRMVVDLKVKDCAERRLLDSLALDHLLASLPRDDVKDEPSQTADKLLDGEQTTVFIL